MWTQKKADGGWQFFERYTDPVTGLKHTVSVKLEKNTAASRKAAQAILSSRIEKKYHKAGQYDSMTLQELLDEYLKRKGIRASTRARDRALSNVIGPILGTHAKINMINASYVKSKLSEAGKEGNRELIARIKALMRWAYQNDYVEDIRWLDKLKKERRVSHDLKDKYMEEDELKTLLDGMKVREWRDLTEFLVLSGLRIGEAIDLTHRDIGKESIRIDSTYGLLTHESGPTKTDAGKRDVTITPQLNACIQRIRKRTIQSKRFLTGPNGSEIKYQTYRKYLAENSERLLGRRISPHALRHTYTSLMAAAGIPLDVIARQLGHEDSVVTRQVYFHITEKLKARDAEMIRKVKLIPS